MKTRLMQCVLGGASSFIAVFTAIAQPDPSLTVRLYAGVNITGTPGTVFAVQATTNVTESNSWMTADFVRVASTNHFWTDSSAPATGVRFYRAIAIAPTNLVFIPPGTFRLGSPSNEVDRGSGEGPQTTVTISKGCFMGKYKVTQGDYLAVAGVNPSYFNTNNGYSLDLARPVETVSWYDASNYCVLRTKQELAAGLIPSGSRYRLPTETEREYACRAGTSDRRLYYGDDSGYVNLAKYAWYSANSSNMTHAVGQKLPNQWGLYDMAGNVYEWCLNSSWQYPGGSVTDPQGPLLGTYRHTRGGSWNNPANNCRSAQRFVSDPAGAGFGTGFRVVLVAGT